jgi:hypothetical protein
MTEDSCNKIDCEMSILLGIEEIGNVVDACVT